MINSSEKDLKKFGFKFTDPSERKKKNWNKISIPKNFKDFGFEFFDGNSLGIGYQGYKYKKEYFDQVAKNLVKKFKLTSNSKVLEIGCAKGCLIYDLLRYRIQVYGLDVSFYARNKSVPQIKNNIKLISNLNFLNKKYDLIISLNVLNYFKYSQIDNIINLIRNKSEKNFIIIETISNSIKRKQFLSSDPNYKIGETHEWWNNKFKKHNFNINNIFYRDMV